MLGFAKVVGKSWKVVLGCSYKGVQNKAVQYPCSETVVDQPTVVEVFCLFRHTHTHRHLCFPKHASL